MDNAETLKYFKSINIYPKTDELKSDFIPGTDAIIRWLQDFHGYFQTKLKITQGENFHTLYNREVSVHSEDLLLYDHRITDIANFSKSIGYGYSITLDIRRIIANKEKVDYLIREEVITSLGIIIEDTEESLKSCIKEYTALLTGLAGCKISLGLIAPLEILYQLKILQLPAFNSLNFTVYPINHSPNRFFNANPITSCSRHFRILIDEDGLIYSCLGLFGLKEYALGSIYLPPEELIFEQKNTTLNFKQLIEEGPSIPLDHVGSRQRVTGLPQMCELHRVKLTGS